MRRNRFPLWCLTGMMMLALISPGCGKKDDPMPPKIKLPAITDLGVTSIREGIALAWSLTDQVDGVGEFKLLRSEPVPGSQACPGCPQNYRPYRTVAVADDRLQREGEKRFRYVDANVRTGSSFFYRIVVCDRRGHCGDASNEAGMTHTIP